MKMRKLLLIFTVVLISLSFSGCKQYIKGRDEIDRLSFIRVAGIDKGENDNVMITVASKSVSMQGGNAGAQENKSKVMISEGRTIFEAVRKLSIFSEKRPFFGHIEFILIGEELAKEGILPYIDFFTRDHELRINAKVYLIKGNTARELLENASSNELFIADWLDNLENSSSSVSISSKVPLAEVMFILDNPYLSLYVPCIEMTKSMQKEAENKNKYDINLKGYAIFKDSKLVGHLSGNEARGLNWLRNLIESGIIVVKGSKGEDLSMEIIKSKTKIKPVIYENGSLKATVKVELDTNIAEILGTQGVFNKIDLEYIEKQQEEAVKNEIMSAINFAKNNKMDFFSLGTQFFQKYPKIWDNYEKNWGERVPAIEIDIQVDSKILRTYLLNEPTSRKGE